MNKGPTKAELVAAIRELLDLYINDGAGVEGVIPFEELLLRYEQSVGNVKEAKRLQRSILSSKDTMAEYRAKIEREFGGRQ